MFLKCNESSKMHCDYTFRLDAGYQRCDWEYNYFIKYHIWNTYSNIMRTVNLNLTWQDLLHLLCLVARLPFLEQDMFFLIFLRQTALQFLFHIYEVMSFHFLWEWRYSLTSRKPPPKISTPGGHLRGWLFTRAWTITDQNFSCMIRIW